MDTSKDTFLTLESSAEAVFKEKGSKFLCYAYPVETEEEVRAHLEVLRKKYYDATHHCYAWRLGPKGERFRANDDGEPSSTAGKPILGQLLSREITNALVVVVRYFGGTKLGASGLITAYRESAAAVLDRSVTIKKTVDIDFTVIFGYLVMNDVMRIIKEERPKILDQTFDNVCTMRIRIRKGLAESLESKLSQVEGLHIE